MSAPRATPTMPGRHRGDRVPLSALAASSIPRRPLAPPRRRALQERDRRDPARSDGSRALLRSAPRATWADHDSARAASSIGSTSLTRRSSASRRARRSASIRSNASSARRRGRRSRTPAKTCRSSQDHAPARVRRSVRLSDFEGRLFADPEAVDFYMTLGSGRYRLVRARLLRARSARAERYDRYRLLVVSHGLAPGGKEHHHERRERTGYRGRRERDPPAAHQHRVLAELDDGRRRAVQVRRRRRRRVCAQRGGGLGAVLKGLDRALADGDRVYAVIRGSAVSNDGRSSGSMGTVSRRGQEALLRSAYEDAGIEPRRVRYVEAHGTGTQAGDPVELGALGAVLSEGRTLPAHRAYVGSVKTNVGHTEGAAGVAGLIKVALGAPLRRRHPREPSLARRLHNDGALEPTCRSEIPRTPGRRGLRGRRAARLAGVSGFGIAGTNAHVVLEEAPAAPRAAATSAGAVTAARGHARAASVLPLSARSRGASRRARGRSTPTASNTTAGRRFARRVLQRRHAAHPARAPRRLRRRRTGARMATSLAVASVARRARGRRGARAGRAPPEGGVRVSGAGRAVGRHGARASSPRRRFFSRGARRMRSRREPLDRLAHPRTASRRAGRAGLSPGRDRRHSTRPRRDRDRVRRAVALHLGVRPRRRDQP